MEQILTVLGEKISQQEAEIKIMKYRLESLEKELKEKDELIEHQSVIIDGLTITVHDLRGESR